MKVLSTTKEKISQYQFIVFLLILVIFNSACNKDEVIPLPSIELISGADQIAYTGEILNDSIEVFVKNGKGEAISSATIQFYVIEGTVSNITSKTDTNGKSKVSWTLGKTPGIQTLSVIILETDETVALPDSALIVHAKAAPKSVLDVDNNKYGAVIIGSQIWMTKDMRATHYSDGNSIPLVEDNVVWSNLGDNNNDKAYCFYNNNTNNESETYGALYTWAAAMNGENSSSSVESKVQGVCPVGWHLPSDSEFVELLDFLGGEEVAGGKMKTTGETIWELPNVGATNSSGFSAIPNGERSNLNGLFFGIGSYCTWWTATEDPGPDKPVAQRALRNNREYVVHNNSKKSAGYPVRCVMD